MLPFGSSLSISIRSFTFMFVTQPLYGKTTRFRSHCILALVVDRKQPQIKSEASAGTPGI